MMGEVRPWKRRLSDDECSVLLAELLLRHPELAAEAEEITSTLLVLETNRNSATRSRPDCGRYVPTGRCPSMRDGDGSWMCSSRTLMTSPGGSRPASIAAKISSCVRPYSWRAVLLLCVAPLLPHSRSWRSMSGHYLPTDEFAEAGADHGDPGTGLALVVPGLSSAHQGL